MPAAAPPRIRREATTKVNLLDLRGNRRQKWIQLTSAVSHWSHIFLQLPRAKCRVECGVALRHHGRDAELILSDTLHVLISFRKSTPTQNRQLDILISDGKHQVDEFVGELTS